MSDSQVTIRAKVLDIIDDFNGYSNYVFENLDYTDWTNHYIMCTRYPNWEGGIPIIGTEGFLVYTYIVAGESYFDSKASKEDIYRYSHIRFDKFLPLQKKIDSIMIME